MSIINDALKKAQRQRTDDPAQIVPPMPGGESGSGGARRGRGRSGSPTVLIASGALALVAVSVIITIILVNRRSTPPVVAAASQPPATKPTATSALPAPAPTVVAPIVAPTMAAPSPVSASSPRTTAKPGAVGSDKRDATPVSAKTAAVRPATSAPETKSLPAPIAARELPAAAPVASPVPATATPVSDTPAANPKGDERVHAFVDTIRVTGIRSSGSDSRVLMNEKVFRVNDLVDRSLNIRLIKVEADNLTFSDANGVTYVKFF